MIDTTFPMRIVSVANLREHWRVTSKRTHAHRRQVALELMVATQTCPALPVTVTLTRIGFQQLDSDNLQSGFKATRDAVASWLGVQDNDPRVTWVYAQERRGPREYATRIQIVAS